GRVGRSSASDDHYCGFGADGLRGHTRGNLSHTETLSLTRRPRDRRHEHVAMRRAHEPVFVCTAQRSGTRELNLRMKKVSSAAPPHEAFQDMFSANASYTENFSLKGLEPVAARGLALVTCMDSRIEPLETLGLEPGDAKILRNAGSRVTDDTLR